MHTKDNRKAAVEVFAHNEEEVTIICPHCSLDKDMNVEKVKDIAHWDIGAFCTRCKRKFNVSFNFREYFRKKVSLKGEISDVSNPETRIGDVIIEDISMKGRISLGRHSATEKCFICVFPGRWGRNKYRKENSGGVCSRE